jgi:hypothetical protein
MEVASGAGPSFCCLLPAHSEWRDESTGQHQGSRAVRVPLIPHGPYGLLVWQEGLLEFIVRITDAPP